MVASHQAQEVEGEVARHRQILGPSMVADRAPDRGGASYGAYAPGPGAAGAGGLTAYVIVRLYAWGVQIWC